jgi:hypothetical protein
MMLTKLLGDKKISEAEYRVGISAIMNQWNCVSVRFVCF